MLCLLPAISFYKIKMNSHIYNAFSNVYLDQRFSTFFWAMVHAFLDKKQTPPTQNIKKREETLVCINNFPAHLTISHSTPGYHSTLVDLDHNLPGKEAL